jgi:hypothetical protein
MFEHLLEEQSILHSDRQYVIGVQMMMLSIHESGKF